MISASNDMLFRVIATIADKAGREAAAAITPEPMVVTDGKTTWHVPEGLCGFAEIKFAGNTTWGRWAKSTQLASRCYDGGLSIWVHQYAQSYELKAAYAKAFAENLRKYNIEARAITRLD